MADLDPPEPPCGQDVVRLANRLLREFNIPTSVEDVDDICAALFVLLYENLFSDRLSDIVRNPESKEDEIHNCQTVIDVLSTDIVHDSLSHIRGIDIVEGDITAISNLLDIFSYLLDYVANRIESDIGTDIEDDKSMERDSFLREKEGLGYGHHSPKHSRDTKSLSSRSSDPKSRFQEEKNGRHSPGINTNDNNCGISGRDGYLGITSHRSKSPSYIGGTKHILDPEDLDVPPSPIRPDNSQSLLGQKTVDSTELDSQFGKEEREYPATKVTWEDREREDLNDRLHTLKLRQDPMTDAVIGGDVASSTAATTIPTSKTTNNNKNENNGRSHYYFTHHLYHHYERPYYSLHTDLSASMPPTHHTPTRDGDKGSPALRSTIGPIDFRSPRTSVDDVTSKRDPSDRTKGLTRSYNDLRHLVERTAAMTRVALQTSPIMGKAGRDLNLSDTSDQPRPTISSDGARLAKELNAQGMRRAEPRSSPTKASKKVAFTSYTDGLTDRSYIHHRQPLEELRDNDFGKDLPPRESGYRSMSHGAKSRLGHSDYDVVEDNFTSRHRSRKTSPEHPRRAKKSTNKAEAFASHLARSRQPELGAAHLKLKTEDRAMKKKQDFLQRLYQEDLGEFSDDVRALLDKDYRTSQEKEKRMLKSYKDSKPVVNGTKKSKSASKVLSVKKPKLANGSATTKRSTSLPRRSTSPPLKLESEEDLLPFLLDEFPHLHLSEHTWHELCRKGLHQIEAITRVYQENKRKKSRAQIQLEEAAQRHEILSDIMRKELDHTKRLRELKEQKTTQLQVKNKTHEKRVQSARARRYYNEYQVRSRAKQLKRRTREEMVFRDLFKDAIKIQKERIKDIRQYATDQRKCQESKRQNEMESLENYYHDQFSLLAEKVAQERKDTVLRDKAQQQMMERIKQELRKKIESEICLYQDQMFRDDDDAHFRQMDADRVKRQLHMARYAAQI